MSTPEEPRWGDPRTQTFATGADPSFDPRSPEWRNPDAQPWWADRAGPPPPGFPQSPMFAGPPRPPRRTRLVVALSIAAALILILGVALTANRSSAPRLVVGPDPLASSGQFPNGGPIASDPPSTDPGPVDPPTDSPTDDPGIVDPPSLDPPSLDPPSIAPTSGDPVGTTKAYYGDLARNHAGPAWNLLCEARQQAMPLADYKAAYAEDVATGTGIVSFTQSGQVQSSGTAAAVPGTLVLADKESVPITVLLVMDSGGWRVCGSDLGGVLPNPGSGSDPGSGVTT